MESSGTETTTPKKKWSVKKKVLATAVVLFALGGVGNAMGGGSPASQPSTPAASQPTEQEPQITTEAKTEVEELPFKTITQDDNSIPTGETRTAQEGKNGSKTTTYELTLTDGVETDKKQMGDPVVVNPVDKIVKNGTYVKPVVKSNCDPNYSGACVPIASDVDCGGGSGNGPAYVYGVVTVVGTDIYGLDRDGDGYGCE
ncbi:MAG TPA: G5 domain-containing protein [Candidatus Saccharimonadales bacterium]|nr:G5 domain-containing protein [Candidatus Saccharimonadales bacterium]